MNPIIRNTIRASSIRMIRFCHEGGYERDSLHPEVYQEEILDGTLERMRESKMSYRKQENRDMFLHKIEEEIRRDGGNPNQIGTSGLCPQSCF
ncbi:2-isopropylmalate synthase [Acrasis kona]|uniref:2-isopropylmalate synthase n=1 Tax=Acrasis kona TaxID=1008807 RepID=A0AAW2YZW8_9EUKA